MDPMDKDPQHVAQCDRSTHFSRIVVEQHSAVAEPAHHSARLAPAATIWMHCTYTKCAGAIDTLHR